MNIQTDVWKFWFQTYYVKFDTLSLKECSLKSDIKITNRNQNIVNKSDIQLQIIIIMESKI